ncbi:malate/L-lactate dehydrogenase [Ancylostoma ceylanicum]|uniref:Malate/L-lactate dehydrogenase n=1 Tax=Ancylostoma ceylanicum TaxID=53326 RepID=A0A0D6L646_9BILA|nr:malate/L-lactate dehydrogenase [Ancylostoma ceylanicum]
MVDCMKSVGVVESHAGQLADVLIEADVRGHYSHGLNRLDMYIKDCQKKVCKTDGVPKILKRQKWKVISGSNHYGIAGWYVMRAMKEGVMAMSFTNTSPIQYPTRASVPALGTNPMAIGVNGTGDDHFLLDMATTTVAIGKVGNLEYKPLAGIAYCGAQACVLGGYKGYGLGAMVEIFCGILSGAHWGPHIRKWMSATTEADLGQCFIAVDPEAFAPGFHERMQEFINTMRNLPAVRADFRELQHFLMLCLFPWDLGGYKGYGLGAMVEIFCGILSGAHWGPHIRKWMSATTEADLGQCFIAVDPEAFAPGFHERMQEFINTMRNLPAVRADFLGLKELWMICFFPV